MRHLPLAFGGQYGLWGWGCQRRRSPKQQPCEDNRRDRAALRAQAVSDGSRHDEAEARRIDEVLATIASAAGLSAVSLHPTRELMLPAGEVAFWLGDTRRAIRLLSTEDIKSAHHNLLLGQAYEREQNLAGARAAYTRVVESTELSIELAWARPIAQARLAAIGR